MLNVEKITDIAQENVTAVNTAGMAYARSVLELAQKNASAFYDMCRDITPKSTYAGWSDLMQEQTKAFASAWSKAYSSK